MRHFNIKVFGLVQGVIFRQSAKKKAEELGLVGFVRNEPDGTVYIEAEGSDEVLEIFVHWCREGPEHASVEKVEAEEGDFENFQEFEIR